MKKGQRNKRINLFEKNYLEMRDQLHSSTKKEIQKEIEHFHDSREWKDDIEKEGKTPVLACLEHPDHKMPFTRREFLDAGFFGTAALALTPALFPSTANALICPTGDTGGGTDRLPLLVIDAQAGASYLGVNVTVGVDSPDNPLANGAYANYGVPAAQAPATKARADMELFGAGSAMLWHPLSVIRREIQRVSDTTGGTFLAKTDGITIACASDDDTANNVLNISQAVVAAGIRGSLAGAIGSANSASGGRSRSLLADPTRNSVQVRDATQANGLVNPGDLGLGIAANAAQRTPRVSYVLQQISRLTQMQSTNHRDLASTAQTVLGCGAESNIANLGAKNFNNMFTDQRVTAAFGNGGPNANDDVQLAVATGAFLALTGEVSVATVQVNGCDYHANSAAQQVARDTDIGGAIGRALRMAEAFNQPLAIYIITDGSASSNGSANTSNAGLNRQTAENGNFSSTHLMVYNPTARTAVTRAQFGGFTANGVLQDGTYPWATSPASAAQVAAVNYLFLAGQLEKAGILGGLPGGVSAIDLVGFGAPVISKSS